MKNALIIIALLGLCGCVAPNFQRPPTHMLQVWNPTELDPYRKSGTGVVAGQAFLKTQGGDVKVAAGEEVSLVPATPFMREALRHFQQNIEPVEYTAAVRSEMNNVIKRTTADAQGNFEFHGVAPGSYLLQVSITWKVPSAYGIQTTGGLVVKEVEIRDGENSRVMLTR